MSATTMKPSAANEKQSERWSLQDNRGRRKADAVSVARSMFPDKQPLPKACRFAVSRARNGSEDNPILRLTDWFVVMRNEGGTREQAREAVLYLDTLVDALWDEDNGDTLEQAIRSEQEADSAEDMVEPFVLANPALIPSWVDALRRQCIATERAIVTALRVYAEHSARK